MREQGSTDLESRFRDLLRANHARLRRVARSYAAAGFWLWGFIHGPRHWPQRLQPEADALQDMIDGLGTPARESPSQEGSA